MRKNDKGKNSMGYPDFSPLSKPYLQKSVLRETTKNPVFIDVPGEFLEVHIRNRQVVFNPLNLRWDGTKLAPRPITQVYNEQWVIRKRCCCLIDDNNERVNVVLGTLLSNHKSNNIN